MARPPIPKRICKKPRYSAFAPMEPVEAEDRGEPVVLTVDEYETIRLIDLEGISREECARRMSISRTTAQAIYNSARAKVARCLVHGLELHIEGGFVCICDGTAGCPNCTRNQGEEQQECEQCGSL